MRRTTTADSASDHSARLGNGLRAASGAEPGALLLTACAASQRLEGPTATAVLPAASGSQPPGAVIFMQAGVKDANFGPVE